MLPPELNELRSLIYAQEAVSAREKIEKMQMF
jgi:hypothetical protein